VVKLDKVVSELPAESGVVDTEAKILSSRELAQRVVDRLGLENDPEFRSGGKGLVKASLGGAGDAQRTQKTVDRVLGKLYVQRAGLTYVIDVNFSSADPRKAARIANAFAQEYLQQQVASKMDDNRLATSSLDAKLDALRQQAEAADAEMQYYKIAHGLMSAEGSTLAEQEVSALNKQIADAQADLAEKQSRLVAAQTQLRRGGGGADIAAAIGNETISKLRSQRAEISRQQADLQTRYGPLHPDVQKIARQVADYDAQIKEEITRVLSSLAADVDISRQRLASLTASRDSAQSRLASTNSAQVGLLELERRAEASKAIYEAFLNRSKEVAAQASIQRADAQVVSKAQVPVKPSAPNTKLNLALGLAFAIAAGLASVVSAEALDGAFHTSRDVQARLGLPSLGSIPTLESVAPGVDRGTLKPEDYVVQRPRSAFAEAFRGLKTALLYAKPGETVQVVAVTSAMPEEGKTLSTLCLGRVAAMGGSKVVIVDCDLRHRSLSGRLDGPVKAGLFEVLGGGARLDAVLRKDEPSGAWILPIAENAWSDPDVFRSPQMEALLATLRERFDLILLDTPPVLAVSDTRVLATVADSVLYLLRWNKTPEAAAENALEQLHAAGAFVPGVALTQVDIRRQVESGYGDSTYYYQSFKKYYAD
jgi:uncharacterized protein involved in exopolysaccharide biosynthesis/Mrp family chromosome partitioning ATPase